MASVNRIPIEQEDSEFCPIVESSSEDDLDEPARKEFKSPRYRKWRRISLTLLVLGFISYYFGRSNLDVASTAFQDQEGYDVKVFGKLITVGYAANVIGRLVSGLAVDYFGGKKCFLGGLFGVVILTLLFTFVNGSLWLHYTIWGINNFVWSFGWGSMVKIISLWYDREEYGKVMGLAAGLSYMMGDAAVRLILGGILNFFLVWRSVFYAAAVEGGLMFIICFIFLKQSPLDIGEKEARASSNNVYGTIGDEGSQVTESIMDFLLPLVKSTKFWILLFQKTTLTLIRAAFLSWTPSYLLQQLELEPGVAGMGSFIFPFFGGVASILSGYQIGHCSKKWRGGLSLLYQILLAVLLVGLYAFTEYFDPKHAAAVPLALTLIAVAALFFQPPYSYCDGIFAMEVAGKKGVGAMVNILNAGGSVGGMIAGYITAAIQEKWDWAAVFIFLAFVGGLTACAGLFFWLVDFKEEPERDFMPLKDEDELSKKLADDRNL